MRKVKDHLSLLNETLNHYSTNGISRSVDSEGACKYYSKGGMCAVGRCLINPKDKDNILKSDNSVGALLSRFNDTIFKKQYRGYNEDFWGDLQDLHDNDRHWSEGKLTLAGENHVSLIKYNIEDGGY